MITNPVSRRGFITQAIALSAVLGSGPAFALQRAEHRTLTVESLHTGEKCKATFWEQGHYNPDALAELNTIMRDHRTGDVFEIDQNLYDALYALSAVVEAQPRFQLISGYRSPKTNAKLAANGNGVAKKSYHMRGMASDIRAERVDLDRLHKAAKALKAGGVGKYVRSNFVHVDVGPVRYW
ncbi:DUF882 domain-containing protein [Hwanghaeella sp.]|uniref:DUF882 domain-containing protein n=1 Tax=Hwanghaeella sp. TaxID=2605943 RepID=UPI003CCC4001